MKTENYPIAEIDWIDSNMDLNGWIQKDIDSLKETDLGCKSVGYIVHRDSYKVSLVMNISPNCFSQIITIPKCSIIHIKILKDGLENPDAPVYFCETVEKNEEKENINQEKYKIVPLSA